jgi:hypothetical protein
MMNFLFSNQRRQLRANLDVQKRISLLQFVVTGRWRPTTMGLLAPEIAAASRGCMP